MKPLLQRVTLALGLTALACAGAGCSTTRTDPAARAALSQAMAKATGLGVTYRSQQILDVASLSSTDRQAVASKGSRFAFEGTAQPDGTGHRVAVRNVAGKDVATFAVRPTSVTVAGPGGAPTQMPRTGVPEILLPVSLSDVVAAANRPELRVRGDDRRVSGSLTSAFAAAGSTLQEGTFELTLGPDDAPRHLTVVLSLALETPLPSGTHRIALTERFDQSYGPATPESSAELSTARQILALFSAA